MPDKPRLIWHSNAPFTGTGYGQQSALFTLRLKDRYALSISAYYGLEGAPIPWNGIPVLPGITGDHGDDFITEHVRTLFGDDLRKGLVVTLMDVWVLNPLVWGQFNVASWVPVDHQPCPDPVWQFFENSGAIPIAMSRFGQAELNKFGLDALYCPHAVDTSVYKPKDQREAREETKMEQDVFIVGMVAANKGNPSRKCFQEAFQAFKKLYDRNPDARLYLHTDMAGRFQGIPLMALLKAVGVPHKAVIVCDQYRTTHFPFPDETMASIYSSLDCLLMPSAGEGFGVPAIEAQACGTPVIVSDFSAQPELCGSGWTVTGTKHYTPIGSWQFTPDVDDIYDALKQAYNAKGNERIAKKAREFAAEYDIEHVLTEHMLPALEEAQARFDARRPVELKAVA